MQLSGRPRRAARVAHADDHRARFAGGHRGRDAGRVENLRRERRTAEDGQAPGERLAEPGDTVLHHPHREPRRASGGGGDTEREVVALARSDGPAQKGPAVGDAVRVAAAGEGGPGQVVVGAGAEPDAVAGVPRRAAGVAHAHADRAGLARREARADRALAVDDVGVERLAGRDRPAVVVVERLAEVGDDAALARDVPLVAAEAVEQQRADLLVAGAAVPLVDLAIRRAHPAAVGVFPRADLVGLRDVDRQAAGPRRVRVQVVTVRAEVVVVRLVRRAHVRLVDHEGGIRAVRVGVDGDRVESALPEQLQHADVVLHEAQPAGRGGPVGPERAGNHLVAGVAGQGLDCASHLAEGLDVAVGGDLLGDTFVARPLLVPVHLVADDPDVGAGRGGDEARGPLREGRVVLHVGKRAVRRAVAVVQPHDDAEALIGPRPVVAAARVVRVAAELLGEQDPALALVGHVRRALGVVDPEDEGRLAVALRRRGSGGADGPRESEERDRDAGLHGWTSQPEGGNHTATISGFGAKLSCPRRDGQGFCHAGRVLRRRSGDRSALAERNAFSPPIRVDSRA